MYEVDDNRYCYPNSMVLKNKADLRTQDELAKFETLMITQRSDEPLPVARHFNVKHYRAVHAHLFQDVYTWAGRLRTVRISKAGSMFCYPENIGEQLRLLFASLSLENEFRDLEQESFARKAAHFLADLNAVHPFREGNGRTQTVYLSVIANQAGHPLDLERLHPNKMMSAMIASFHGDEEPLVAVILELMRRRS
ncbi:Fic family protein [Bradyrhizobium sp. U531]|uniref:Fic/DOC family protein n=1 Tax=Bradyrhizobium sp. U531 TaxID=3053458 RepID=UPI003F437E87